MLLVCALPSAVMEKQRNVSGCVGPCWGGLCGCCRAVRFTARSWENWVHLPAQRPASTHAKKDFTAWWAAPRTELWSTLPGSRTKVSERNKYWMWWCSCIRLSALSVFFFCCSLATGSWSNVEQAVFNLTEGLDNIPNQTLKTKLEESLSLVKRCRFLSDTDLLDFGSTRTQSQSSLLRVNYLLFPSVLPWCFLYNVTCQSIPTSLQFMPSSCWRGPWIWLGRYSQWSSS